MNFGRMNFESKKTPIYHPSKPLGFGQLDGWVWTTEQIKLINRLCGAPREIHHPDYKTLFLVSTRTPLYLMEKAGKELSTRVIIEHEFPRLLKHRKDLTTLYLQILWREVFNHNEFHFPKVGWPKSVHQRKLKPIEHYESFGCDSSEQFELLIGMMVVKKGTSTMPHNR